MALFEKDGHLTVKGNHYQVGELLEMLPYVKGENLANFLQSIGLNIPRKMRMGVLKNVLKTSVEKTIEERKSLADEMGYRLTWFAKYTDTQLVNLLEWYKSPSLSQVYLQELWNVLLPYLVEKGVAEGDLETLFTLAEAAFKKKEKVLSKEFNDALNKVLFDVQGEIDGVTQEAFRPVLYKSSTLTELRAIGAKYHAPIPKRLKKSEMLDIILNKLKERGALTKELEEKLKHQNIILLERFAKDHDIKVSTELKKEEIIEFILSNANETRETYYVPSSSAVYEKDLVEVEDSSTETNVVAPVTVHEEVVAKTEEKSVEAPRPVVQPIYTETIDYRPQFERLAKAFESLAESLAQKDFNIIVNNEVKEVTQVEKVESVVPVEQPTPQPVGQSTNLDALQTHIISELLKDDDDAVVLSNEEKTTEKEITKEKATQVAVKHAMPRFPLVMASILAFLSFVLLLGLGIIALPQVNQLSLITPYITFYDLTSLDPYLLAGVAGGIGLFNLIASLRFRAKKVKRGEVLFFSIFTLITGFVVTGLFGIIAVLSKGKEVRQFDPTDPVERIVDAINNIGGVSSGRRRKKSVFSSIMSLIGWLIVLSCLAFLGLFAIWRLDFTYGYENIEFIGPFIRDQIIIPIFGSAHEIVS